MQSGCRIFYIFLQFTIIYWAMLYLLWPARRDDESNVAGSMRWRRCINVVYPIEYTMDGRSCGAVSQFGNCSSTNSGMMQKNVSHRWWSTIGWTIAFCLVCVYGVGFRNGHLFNQLIGNQRSDQSAYLFRVMSIKSNQCALGYLVGHSVSQTSDTIQICPINNHHSKYFASQQPAVCQYYAHIWLVTLNVCLYVHMFMYQTKSWHNMNLIATWNLAFRNMFRRLWKQRTQFR